MTVFTPLGLENNYMFELRELIYISSGCFHRLLLSGLSLLHLPSGKAQGSLETGIPGSAGWSGETASSVPGILDKQYRGGAWAVCWGPTHPTESLPQDSSMPSFQWKIKDLWLRLRKNLGAINVDFLFHKWRLPCIASLRIKWSTLVQFLYYTAIVFSMVSASRY